MATAADITLAGGIDYGCTIRDKGPNYKQVTSPQMA